MHRPVLVQLVEPDSTAVGAPFRLSTSDLLWGMSPLRRMRSITITPAAFRSARFLASASSLAVAVFGRGDLLIAEDHGAAFRIAAVRRLQALLQPVGSLSS